MRAFSYLGARKLSLQVAAPPLAALMAEAALREHASSREVELTDAPEPQSIPPADALFEGTPVGAAPMELDNAEDPATIDDPCTDVTQSADDVPVPNGLRTVVDSVETKRVITRGAAGNAVEGSNEVVGSQAKAPPISLSPGK